MYKVIPIVGPPGAGKSTLANYLALNYRQLVNVDCGELGRAEINASTPEGKVFKEHIEKGEFIPDDLFMKVFNNTLEVLADSGAFNPSSQYMLSVGSPRTIFQSRCYDDAYEIPFLVHCRCPRHMCYYRLSKRKERLDSSDDAILRRLDEFPTITLPAILYFTDRVMKINTFLPIKNVFDDAKSMFDWQLNNL